MSKRSYNELVAASDQTDRTIDFAEPAKKRTKLQVMPASSNKIGTFDEAAQITRTSNLMKPTMLLEGHTSALYACKFSDDGVHIASAGGDRDIMLWHTYGECENHTTLRGHQGSVLCLEWSGGGDYLFSACTDHTGAIWDVERQERIKKIKEHSSLVNCISCTKRGMQYYATGSDDGTAKLFDMRMRPCLQRFDCSYQVTSVALVNNGMKLFTGGIDNIIKVWDTRMAKEPLYGLMKHRDTITSLRLSPDQNYLLSNGMDNRLCIWDVRAHVMHANNSNNTNNLNSNNSNSSSKKNMFGGVQVSERTRKALEEVGKGEKKGLEQEKVGMEEEEEEDDDVADIAVKTGEKGKKKKAGKAEISDDEEDDEAQEKAVRLRKDKGGIKELLSQKKKETNGTNGTNGMNRKKNEMKVVYDNESESENRLYRVFGGPQHGNEKILIKANWSGDGKRVCCGSSDKLAYVFDVDTGKLLYRLPGHKGCVNEVDYHPMEPIILSCSSDKTMFLGEL